MQEIGRNVATVVDSEPLDVYYVLCVQSVLKESCVQLLRFKIY